jgi:zinc/manganese transport system substrate-binding protein
MPVVTFHSSWAYLSARLGFPVVETLEPKPGIPPSPGHLLNVIKATQERKVGLIVLEPFYERKAADFVASKTGAPVAVLSNNAASEAPDAYLEMLDRVIAALAEAATRSS